MHILRYIFAVIGFFIILGSLRALSGVAEIQDSSEKAGYITAVAIFLLVGVWLLIRPLLVRRKRK